MSHLDNPELNLQYQLNILQAASEGKTIQYRVRNGDPWKPLTDPASHAFSFFMHTYRVQPTLKRVPLTAEDLPPGTAIRLTTLSEGSYKLVLAVRRGKVEVLGNTIAFDALVRGDYVYSTDAGKTWKPCWKEVPESVTLI